MQQPLKTNLHKFSFESTEWATAFNTKPDKLEGLRLLKLSFDTSDIYEKLDSATCLQIRLLAQRDALESIFFA